MGEVVLPNVAEAFDSWRAARVRIADFQRKHVTENTIVQSLSTMKHRLNRVFSFVTPGTSDQFKGFCDRFVEHVDAMSESDDAEKAREWLKKLDVKVADLEKNVVYGGTR